MFSTERSKYRSPMSSLLMMPRRVADNIENRRRKPAKPNFKCHLTLPRQVRAIERVERLKGSTEPVLMRADDGHLYVVKFCTNPLGPRILVNEYLAVRLARSLGMATPEAAVVQVPESLGSPGLHFGSRLYKSRGNVYIHDWLPAAVWGLVTNPGDLIGAYVFDAWTGNADCRQVIFVRKAGLTPYQLLLIDNGHCFGGKSWRLHGLAVQCPRKLSFAYATVGDWSDLEPWLSRIENLDPAEVGMAAEGMPEEWLVGNERVALMRLLRELAERRLDVRANIAALLNRGDHPFSCWRFRSSLFLVPPCRALGKTA